MSFIAANTPTDPASPGPVELTNITFYPNLSVDDFTSAMRINHLATPARVAECLKQAMFEVNRRTVKWVEAHRQNGVTTLSAVSLPPWLPENGYRDLYHRAVWALAKAQLIERWRDYDTTAAGEKKSDALEESSEQLRRDSLWATHDLLGIPRSTVELI